MTQKRKTTFDGRWPLIEDDLWQKTTFVGRWLLLEDDLLWKTTFDGRQTLTEDDPWRKTPFDGRGPLTEEDLWRKTTFNRRQLSIGCLVYYLKKMFTTPYLDSHSTTDPKPEIEFPLMQEMYGALCMYTCAEKTTFGTHSAPYSAVRHFC